LADEPTASLDDESAAAAMALLLGGAQRSGATLVVATHDDRASQALRAAAPDLVHLRLQRPAVEQQAQP
jgi:putative ABC transport system ATP-binding protein